MTLSVLEDHLYGKPFQMRFFVSVARSLCTCRASCRVIASCLLKVADFNLPHLHLTPPLGVIPLEFRQDFLASEITRVPGLSCGVVCVILRLAVLTK